MRGGERKGWAAAALASLAVVAAVAGVWLMVTGLTAPPEAAPEPVPFTIPPSVPADDTGPAPELAADRLSIPALAIDAPVLVGGVSLHSLDIPGDPGMLTLYDAGGQPCGVSGTVLVAGHVVSGGSRGALWTLHEIQPNAVAWLSCGDGTVTRWRAVAVEVTHKQDLPQDLFNADGPRRLAVVTCGGPVVDGHYVDNVIVYFDPWDR